MIKVPTEGESYAKLIEFLRKAQEECATLSHLVGLQGDRPAASRGWLIISEQLKLMLRTVTKIATGKLQ